MKQSHPVTQQLPFILNRLVRRFYASISEILAHPIVPRQPEEEEHEQEPVHVKGHKDPCYLNDAA
jgi:hypothetical protein